MISIAPTDLQPAYDAVVVGAGVGGLVCAGFLRRAGMRVLVLDHHYLPGGYCTAFPRKGYLFDAAVHHIGACGRFGVVGQVLQRLGVDVSFVRLDPMDELQFDDERFTIPAEYEEYRAALAARFPEEAGGVEVLFRDMVRLYRQILQSRGALYERYLAATFEELLDDYVHDPRLRRILGGQWGYLGSPTHEISAIGMVQMLVSYLRDGAWYPVGSTQRFSDALAQSLLDRGGHVLLRHKVDEILVDGGAVSGVRLADGRTVRAPLVVSNVDARQLLEDLLPPEACAAERARIHALEAGPSYFGLYLGLNGSADLSRLPRGFYYPAAGDCEGAVEWIYLSITTRYDPTLAPSGHHVLSATVGVRSDAPQFEAWQADKSAMADSVLDFLEARVPRIREHVELAESASPRTLARYTLAKDGAAYGWAVLPDQAGDRRLPPDTSVDGLYLVGQWTVPGPGVAAVAASGWSVANRIRAGALEGKSS